MWPVEGCWWRDTWERKTIMVRARAAMWVIGLGLCSGLLLGCPNGGGEGTGEGEGEGQAASGPTFLDRDLDIAVRDALGAALSGPLGAERVATLTELDTGGRLFDTARGKLVTIDTLSGLEWAVNLRTLLVPNSLVTNVLPIANLNHLTELRLNPDLLLTSIAPGRVLLSSVVNLARLTNLTSLDLRGNTIQFIGALQNMTALEVLDLSGNPLINIQPLAYLSNLTELYLGGNLCNACEIEVQLTVLQNLPNLEVLDLSGLAISNLSSLVSLAELRVLDLSNNEVSDLRFLSGLTNLEELYLSRNSITSILYLSKLTKLRILDIEVSLEPNQDSITDLDVLLTLPDLEFVNVEGNALDQQSVCDVIPDLLAVGVDVRFDPGIECTEAYPIPSTFAGRWEVTDCFQTVREYILAPSSEGEASGTIHIVVRFPGNLDVPGDTEVFGTWAVAENPLTQDTLTITQPAGQDQSLTLPILSRSSGRFVLGGSLTGGTGCNDTWTRSLVESKED